VTVYVSVTGANGEPVGVDPAQIHLFENGQPVQMEQISGVGEIGPLTVLLALDVSGSMNNGGKLEAAKAAAQAYVDQMRPGDQAGLLTFNQNVEYVQAVTSDHSALIQAIQSLTAKDDTAMFDALAEAIQILQEIPGRKAIIVLTDGMDNRSQATADDVIQDIGDGGLSISTIGLGDPEKPESYFGLDATALQSLAECAGGVYSFADNPGDLRKLYELYGRALQSEYRITYTSLSALRDGLSRGLSVSLDGGATSAQAQYNPGGVLPEASGNAWSVFIITLAVLVVLLFIPGVVGRIWPRKRKPRIKLK